ncbi:MAG: hypothetical protein WA152_00135 [Microgenomates group bacterium]
MNLSNSSPVRFIYSFLIGYVMGIISFHLFVNMCEYLVSLNSDFSTPTLSAIASFFELAVPFIISVVTVKIYKFKSRYELPFLRLYLPQLILLPAAWFIGVWYWGLITNRTLTISFSMPIGLILLHHLITFCLLLLPTYLINVPKRS